MVEEKQEGASSRTIEDNLSSTIIIEGEYTVDKRYMMMYIAEQCYKEHKKKLLRKRSRQHWGEKIW